MKFSTKSHRPVLPLVKPYLVHLLALQFACLLCLCWYIQHMTCHHKTKLKMRKRLQKASLLCKMINKTEWEFLLLKLLSKQQVKSLQCRLRFSLLLCYSWRCYLKCSLRQRRSKTVSSRREKRFHALNLFSFCETVFQFKVIRNTKNWYEMTPLLCSTFEMTTLSRPFC